MLVPTLTLAAFCFLPGASSQAPPQDLRPERILHEPTGVVVNFPDHPNKKSAKSGDTLSELYESDGPDGSRFMVAVYYREKPRGSGETTEDLADAVCKNLIPNSKVSPGFFGRSPAKFYSGTFSDSGEKFYVWTVPLFDTVVRLGVSQAKGRPFPEKAADAFFDSFVLSVDMVHPTGPRERVRSDMTTLAGAFTTPILDHQVRAPEKAGENKLLLFNLQEGKVTYQLIVLEPPAEKRKDGLAFRAVEKLRDDMSKEVGARPQKVRKFKIGVSDALEWELEKSGATIRFRCFVLGQAIYLMQYVELGGFDADRATKFMDSFHPAFRSFR